MATQLTATAPQADNTDQSLPDASGRARWVLFGLLVLAAGVALIWNGVGKIGAPAFTPTVGGFNFSLFAAFYAAAQIIERLMELAVPLLPIPLPQVQDPSARAAQVKADRGKIVLGLAALLGVAVSCGFGLLFLQTIGIKAPSNTIDTLATGLLIAAGTKPLHDFISLLQNQNTPTTGTTAAKT